MKKKIILFALIIVSILIASSIIILKYPYSRGVRTGKLVKLSKKGLILTTYEGVLDLGSGDQLTWNFSVRDAKVGKELISHTGQMLSLSYVEHLHRLFFDTKYNIVSWKKVYDDSDTQYLCQFVSILRQNKRLVEEIRPLVSNHLELFKKIKDCQD